jgi:hypothetical protein
VALLQQRRRDAHQRRYVAKRAVRRAHDHAHRRRMRRGVGAAARVGCVVQLARGPPVGLALRPVRGRKGWWLTRRDGQRRDMTLAHARPPQHRHALPRGHGAARVAAGLLLPSNGGAGGSGLEPRVVQILGAARSLSRGGWSRAHSGAGGARVDAELGRVEDGAGRGD